MSCEKGHLPGKLPTQLFLGILFSSCIRLKGWRESQVKFGSARSKSLSLECEISDESKAQKITRYYFS